jgi:hypothetical protein
LSNELSIQFQAEFDEIIVIIERARAKAYRAVNHELISMYWDVGEYVSKKVADGAIPS